MSKNSTSQVLMIRPAQFRANEQTAKNNYFQSSMETPADVALEMALKEFDQMVKALRNKNINVLVLMDDPDTDTPDAIFPNNWISFHDDGTVGLYPMFAQNRRLERRDDILDILDIKGFKIKQKIDLTAAEKEGKYLEGTGSLVLDRTDNFAYAAISDRTHPQLIKEFEDRFGYSTVSFRAFQTVKGKRLPIYHTNVMMSIGDRFCVICLDAIDDEGDKNDLIVSLSTTDKAIIEITEAQMEKFAGNMLQLRNNDDQKFMVMSDTAFQSLTEDQIEELLKYNSEIIHTPLDTIETLGGGSARCMMAEIFLPR